MKIDVEHMRTVKVRWPIAIPDVQWIVAIVERVPGRFARRENVKTCKKRPLGQPVTEMLQWQGGLAERFVGRYAFSRVYLQTLPP